MAIDWVKTGLVPTSGMIAWHAYDAATSTSGNINDLSGNARHIVQASTPPVLTADALYGQYGWLFDGSTSNPLQTASSSTVTPKHVFILASFTDAEFSAESGLISGKTSGDLLYSGTSGTDFVDAGHDNYLLSGVDQPGDWEAPISGIPQLLEITDAGGVALDGFNIGRRKATAGSRWNGYFFDHISYDAIQTGDSLKRIYLYYCLRYAQWRRELPFYFPDSTLISQPRLRFYSQPKDWEQVTEEYEYEDGGMTFNEVASNTVQRWEYQYQIHWQGTNTVSKDPEVLPIFDEFWNQARKANPFSFRDKYGETHTGTRIKSYSRSHQGHKPWLMQVNFELEKVP